MKLSDLNFILAQAWFMVYFLGTSPVPAFIGGFFAVLSTLESVGSLLSSFRRGKNEKAQ